MCAIYVYINSEKVSSVFISPYWQCWRKYMGWCKFASPLGIGLKFLTCRYAKIPGMHVFSKGNLCRNHWFSCKETKSHVCMLSSRPCVHQTLFRFYFSNIYKIYIEIFKSSELQKEQATISFHVLHNHYTISHHLVSLFKEVLVRRNSNFLIALKFYWAELAAVQHWFRVCCAIGLHLDRIFCATSSQAQNLWSSSS